MNQKICNNLNNRYEKITYFLKYYNINKSNSQGSKYNKYMTYYVSISNIYQMQASDYGIIDKFVNPKQYSKAADNSRRRNILLDNYLEIFEKIFTAYREFFEETQILFQVKAHEKIVEIQQLRNFLKKFGQIIKNTSSYQIDCITDLRVSPQDNINKLATQIIPKITSYSDHQAKSKIKLQQLQQKRKQLLTNFSNLKIKTTSNAALYYDYKTMKSKVKQLSQQIKEIEDIEKQLQKDKNQIYHNSEQFQSYLILYRKKLLQNKYNILNRINQHSKHFRNCLTQMLLLLVQCVNAKLEFFNSLVKNQKNDTTYLSQDSRKKKGEDIDALTSNLNNSIQQFYYLVDQVLSIIKGLDTAFKKINTKFNHVISSNKKNLMQNINLLFSIEQTPSKQVTQTFDLYEYYTNKMVGISDKLAQCSHRLTSLKQNVKRYSDVTMSLIKTKTKANEQGKSSQIEMVYEQISYDLITNVIGDIYKSFKETLIDLKTYFNQKFYKKKKNKVQDSMEISHVDQTIIAQKKKPCKDQLWLWRDWRDKASFFTAPPSGDQIKDIAQFIAGIKLQGQSKQIKTYQCSFVGKKQESGFLKICQKALQFTAVINNSGLYLRIPYLDITSAEQKIRSSPLKPSDRYISIQTQKGELAFLKVSDLQGALNLIKQYVQKANKESGGKIIKKQAVQLLPQEIEYLEKNRAKINQLRPNCQNLLKIKSIHIQNITVDQVYQYIYSDKPFTLRGNPQINFFGFANKKAKNFNYKSTCYDKPGPQFYSGNPEVKFTNCPPYSSRTSEFDHPLPKIPFIPMPDSCHCKQKCNIYWVSNEAFDYFVLSESSGAPYADTFVVKILHRVYKEGNGIRIEMLGGLFFVKDVAMKGMLKSKGENEMMQGGQMTMNQMQKSLKIVAGTSEGVESELKQEQTTDKQNTSSSSNQVSKLKNQNKLLIIALVVVFLINLLLRFVIS